ncbi:hypothetical protein VZ94_12090 [Methylocucumis oryzae]|uniref:Uncharacterized protein n=1 Tax=Methylocucumis oryzae TaxID=1632867 RepID=A0A0F3II33_9GAMM|nr:hypothetical protein VZ94_12090 [Methylocucumis oryzae]
MTWALLLTFYGTFIANCIFIESISWEAEMALKLTDFDGLERDNIPYTVCKKRRAFFGKKQPKSGNNKA